MSEEFSPSLHERIDAIDLTGQRTGRVEVDGYFEGELFLEVIDESVFGGGEYRATVVMDYESATKVAEALLAATAEDIR